MDNKLIMYKSSVFNDDDDSININKNKTKYKLLFKLIDEGTAIYNLCDNSLKELYKTYTVNYINNTVEFINNNAITNNNNTFYNLKYTTELTKNYNLIPLDTYQSINLLLTILGRYNIVFLNIPYGIFKTHILDSIREISDEKRKHTVINKYNFYRNLSQYIINSFIDDNEADELVSHIKYILLEYLEADIESYNDSILLSGIGKNKQNILHDLYNYFSLSDKNGLYTKKTNYYLVNHILYKTFILLESQIDKNILYRDINDSLMNII